MHSFWQRANSLFTYSGTVLAVMCLLTTMTDYFHVANPYVDVTFSGVEGLQQEFDHDRAYVVFNMTTDLRSEFTWNTKQIYVYVTFDFSTPKNEHNQMTMWNDIILEKENAFIRIPILRAQYPFVVSDQGYNLKGRPFNVTVFWNVMPRVGALYTRSKSFSGFTLPNEYLEPKKGKIRGSGQQ